MGTRFAGRELGRSCCEGMARQRANQSLSQRRADIAFYIPARPPLDIAFRTRDETHQKDLPHRHHRSCERLALGRACCEGLYLKRASCERPARRPCPGANQSWPQRCPDTAFGIHAPPPLDTALRTRDETHQKDLAKRHRRSLDGPNSSLRLPSRNALACARSASLRTRCCGPTYRPTPGSSNRAEAMDMYGINLLCFCERC